MGSVAQRPGQPLSDLELPLCPLSSSQATGDVSLFWFNLISDILTRNAEVPKQVDPDELFLSVVCPLVAACMLLRTVSWDREALLQGGTRNS